MGYTPEERIAHVVIADGGPFDGLELDLNLSISMDEFIAYHDRRFGPNSTIASQNEAYQWFGDNVLRGWNYERPAGTPIAPGWEGLKTVDVALMLEIMDKWRQAVVDVPAPLGNGSSASSISARERSTTTGPRSRSRGRRSTRT